VHDGSVRVRSILIVDDEPMVRDVLTRYLAAEGFDVVAAEDGEEALERFADRAPALVLLDLMLPKVDGYEVFRRIRERRDGTPVIMLTARGEEMDRIVGLDLGADDYVAKPFSPREVVARVRAVLRRAGAGSPNPTILDLGRVSIDTGRREVLVDGDPASLTRMEFDLLAFLASSPGTTFTRAQLLDGVWDFAWDGDSATVTVHVRRLRQKIAMDPSNPRHLVTVWGVGYRFEP
jgi:DNA-binding response OmpR family regulator